MSTTEQASLLPSIDEVQNMIGLLKAIDTIEAQHRIICLEALLGHLQGYRKKYYVPNCHCKKQCKMIICNKDSNMGRVAQICANKEDDCGFFKFRGWNL